MSLIVRDFECLECGHKYDAVVQRHVRVMHCPVCHDMAVDRPSAPKLAYLRMGVDPTMTTAADKWAKAHAPRRTPESDA